MDRGQAAAFTGALDRPPSSSWEIMNPREYEKGHVPAIPYLPDIHPLVDSTYRPYDIGQVGQLDLHILAGLFGGDRAARDLTPAWDGGIYWAGQTPERNDSGAAGQHQIHLALLPVHLEERSLRAGVCPSVCRRTGPSNTPASSSTRPHPAPPANPTGRLSRCTAPTRGRVVITRRGSWCLSRKASTCHWRASWQPSFLGSQGSGPLQCIREPTGHYAARRRDAGCRRRSARSPDGARGAVPVELRRDTKMPRSMPHFRASYPEVAGSFRVRGNCSLGLKSGFNSAVLSLNPRIGG